MGEMLGNILALVFIIVSALAGIISLEASAFTFIAISYSLWIIIFLTNIFTKPVKDALFCQLLYSYEIEVYQRYHLHFWFPDAAQAYSTIMNMLRLPGFIWGGLCFWNGLYWLGGLSIAYFFITGGLIAKLHPGLYIVNGAKKGNKLAIEQVALIRTVQDKREEYNKTQEA